LTPIEPTQTVDTGNRCTKLYVRMIATTKTVSKTRKSVQSIGLLWPQALRAWGQRRNLNFEFEHGRWGSCVQIQSSNFVHGQQLAKALVLTEKQYISMKLRVFLCSNLIYLLLWLNQIPMWTFNGSHSICSLWYGHVYICSFTGFHWRWKLFHWHTPGGMQWPSVQVYPRGKLWSQLCNAEIRDLVYVSNRPNSSTSVFVALKPTLSPLNALVLFSYNKWFPRPALPPLGISNDFLWGGYGECDTNWMCMTYKD